MTFLDERGDFEQELDAYYSTYPTDLSIIERDLRQIPAQYPRQSPYEWKARGYAVLAAKCPVKVFRHFPFYVELNTGRHRTELGSRGLGAWMKSEPMGKELQAQGEAWWAPCGERGLSNGWLVVDDNHQSIGYDVVLQRGLLDIRRQATDRLCQPCDDRQRAFLQSSVEGLDALMAVASRFSDEAARLAAAEGETAIRVRLQRLADTARRVPGEAPATFYEALCTILFLREVVTSLDANGISVYGHVDRLLGPFLNADLAAGRTTLEEARDLLRFFLAFCDARYGMGQAQPWHVGTNSTIGVGGCDQAGTPIFNEVTRMILEASIELEVVDPKINARVSAAHGAEYLELLARHVASGRNSLAVFNDDVVIAANVKTGKAVQDARLYVGGGCQENVLQNCEVNNRATMYLNMAQVLRMGFAPQAWADLARRDGYTISPFAAAADFEALYAAYLRNLKGVIDAHIDQRNRTERQGWRYNPCPLHSSMIEDCLSAARDMMEGGARYNGSSVSLAGIGTVIDSLLAIRQLVFVERRLGLDELTAILEADFAGQETLRQYILHRLPKFGRPDRDAAAFSARVFADVAAAASGRANTRGGRYEASLFAFRSFADLGARTGATPDGRKAGWHVSPGMGPSPLALQDKSTLGDILGALAPLDLTDYPVVAVLDVKLPANAAVGTQVIVSVLRRFLAAGGSVLQVNYVSPELLQEARIHPERHGDLVVRVSGYSSYFTRLAEPIQNEIIARAAVGERSP